MQDKILIALEELDVKNDDHWTDNGQPRLDVVEQLVGEKVSRQAINKVAKTFNRENPVTIDENEEHVSANSDFEVNQEIDEDTYIENEFKEAQANFDAASRRLAKARHKMDQLITKLEVKAKAEKKTAFSENIKRYQESQLQQRRAKIEKEKKVQDFLKGL